MINLKRPDVRLANLDKNDAVTERKAEIEAWLAGREPLQPEFEDFWTRDDVKGALIAMQGWVCAYCQNKVDQVDHYRPKAAYQPENPQPNDPAHGGYPWLCYSWTNLLYVCGECNGRKGNKFPLVDEKTRLTKEERHQGVESEKPILLNPSVDDVTDVFVFEPDKEFGFSIRARPGHPLEERAKKTLGMLKLNSYGRKKLKTALSHYIQNRGFSKPGATSTGAPFGWIARQISQTTPSKEDNLISLLMKINLEVKKLEKLVAHDEHLKATEEECGDMPTYRELAQCRWALAILIFIHGEQSPTHGWIEENVSKDSQRAIKRHVNTLKKNHTA